VEKPLDASLLLLQAYSLLRFSTGGHYAVENSFRCSNCVRAGEQNEYSGNQLSRKMGIAWGRNRLPE